jgi:hypothetical protein
MCNLYSSDTGYTMLTDSPGEPLPREAQLFPLLCARLPSRWSRAQNAAPTTAPQRLPTECSVPASRQEVKTPARVIAEAPLSIHPRSCKVWFPGVRGVPRLDTPESILGSALFCLSSLATCRYLFLFCGSKHDISLHRWS